jgi:hypothetical protein
MAGGILNLVSEGTENVIIHGNPKKTFFKTKYEKHTNFGLQKFRIDYDGSRTLRLTEDSIFDFKISRYGDLLMDTYISIDLPHVWSPILPPKSPELQQSLDSGNTYTTHSDWQPYEFQWIKHIGSHMIKNIKISCGNQIIQEYSGEYLLSSVNRDFTAEKKELYNNMTGHIPELNDPANVDNNNGNYPNAYSDNTKIVTEPSIYGKTLLIPINSLFSFNSEMAFPLLSLQYNVLTIQITIRPINELFTIRDVYDDVNGNPRVAPRFNEEYMQFYKFLHYPENVSLEKNTYSDSRERWNTEIHLICNYGFLSDAERKLFSANEQKYLIKQVRETKVQNLVNKVKTEIETNGLVSSFMFYLQRSDIKYRNEWSNYTNWEYADKPNGLYLAHRTGEFNYTVEGGVAENLIGPGVNPGGTYNDLYITGLYDGTNTKDILNSLALVIDGLYRENEFSAGVYNYIEQYIKSYGKGTNGVYYYNFGLKNDLFKVQPSGAFNTNKINLLEFELNLITPPINLNSPSYQLCDLDTGEIIGTTKQNYKLYKYSFDLTVFEERYNILHFKSGNCGMTYQ